MMPKPRKLKQTQMMLNLENQNKLTHTCLSVQEHTQTHIFIFRFDITLHQVRFLIFRTQELISEA